MAVFRSLVYLIGFGGLGYTLMRVLAKDDKSQLPSDYSVSRGESLKKRQAIVDVLHRAAKDREPMYRQTKEQIDAQRAEDYSKKKH